MNINHENNNIELLIHEYLQGVISEKNKVELFEWINQDPSNLKYFNHISDIWLSSSVFQTRHKFNSRDAFKRVKNKINDVFMKNTPNRKSIHLPVQWAVAILLFCVFLGGVTTRLFFKSQDHDDSSFSFEVPYGSKSNILLPDGSRVVLNAGSQLTCKQGFGISHRDLNLTGEGYFNVSKNKKLPFIVHTDHLNIRALGTEFNVKAYPEDANIETILVHGSIRINTISLKKEAPEELILMPKQKMVYNKQKETMQVAITVEKQSESKDSNLPKPPSPKIWFAKTTINPVIYTSWKDPSWNIFSQDLGTLAVLLERKYDVKIHFESDNLRKLKFTGTLKDESLEQVLAVICIASPLEYKIKGKQVEFKENKELMKQYRQYFGNQEN